MNLNGKYEPKILERVQYTQTRILAEFINICEANKLSYFLIFGSALGAIRHKGSIPWDDDIDVGMLREDYNKFLEIYTQKGFGNLELMTPALNENYASSVTHLQLKNTTFVSEYARDMKCHLGINIDIFPFDKVSNNDKIMKKQLRYTYVLRKLLFLSGSPHPYIPCSGPKKIILQLSCYFIHLSLRFLHLTPKYIYCKFQKYCMLSNAEKSNFVLSYGDYLDDKGVLSLEDIYPLRDARYEDLNVKIPNNICKHLKAYYGEDFMKIPPKDKQVNHSPIKIDFEK